MSSKITWLFNIPVFISKACEAPIYQPIPLKVSKFNETNLFTIFFKTSDNLEWKVLPWLIKTTERFKIKGR